MSDRMSRADRQRWASARTLADLGELTAQWIEGRIGSQPGYYGPSDIEDPALIPVLARLNRAGFITTGSQAGLDEGDGRLARCRQRAAVEGFADYAMVLEMAAAAGAGGLTAVVHAPRSLPRWRYRYDRAEVVTLMNGQTYTRFGVQVPRRHIRSAVTGYGICHRDAVTALFSAWQVTIIDPEWGRDPSPLWDVLGAALRPAPRMMP